jgi:hypothetical protein
MLAALAWNNLLAFPYLCGYSMETLSHLLKPFAFVPVMAAGDTLTRLADHGTKRWAALEECVLKVAWRAVSRRQPARAPWLDLYYRATH